MSDTEQGAVAPGYTPDANAAAAAARHVDQVPPNAPGDQPDTVEQKIEQAHAEQAAREEAAAAVREVVDAPVVEVPAVDDGIAHGTSADGHVDPGVVVEEPVVVEAPPAVAP